MRMYDKGNDIAADQYAAECSKQGADSDWIEARKDELLFNAVWVAENIDEVIGCDDLNSDGNTHHAADIANILIGGYDARGFFESLRKAVAARAYDQAESELDNLKGNRDE